MAVPILTREQLVDFATIQNLYQNTKETEQVALYEDLRLQCQKNNISLRSFNTIYKQVADSSGVAKAYAKTDCIPDCIKNTGDCYIIDDSGVFLISGKLTIDVCPHPIFPVEILTDINTGFQKIRIAFKRKGVWNDEIMLDRQDIATNKGVIKLANYGILVNDANAGYLVKYFCDIEKLNEDTIPNRYASGCLGYSKFGFIPYAKDVVYNRNNIDNCRRFSLYKQNGDFLTWLESSKKLFNYTIPKILTAAAYSSLLIEKLGINPFGVHLWGETGLGKSVCMLFAASVYGYPDIKNGIVYTGNATANGLEPRLAFNNNCAFFLDELSMLAQKQIDDMIYLIMQGQGKARMSKAGNSQNTYYWNLVSISNAEMPITNDISKGGTFNRIIQVGAEGKVFGDEILPDIANTFKENYGFGAEVFLQLIEMEEVQKEIAALKRDYYTQIIPYTEDKQANAASCILTAFAIANKYIYRSEYELTVDEMKRYIHAPHEISQVMRSYDKLKDWVSSNYRLFDDSEINQSKWGNFSNDSQWVNIYPLRFSEFCKNIAEINEKQFLIGLKQHELLRTNKNELKNNVRINGKIERVITVRVLWVETITAPITSEQKAPILPKKEELQEVEPFELPW